MEKWSSFTTKIPWPAYFTLFSLTMLLFQRGTGASEVEVNASFDSELLETLRPRCPSILQKVFTDKVPSGKAGDKAMIYTPEKGVGSLQECFTKCCDDVECNMSFMFVNNSKISCYKVDCKADSLCLPSPLSDKQLPKLKDKSFMVLVRPKNKTSWANVPGFDLITNSTTEATPTGRKSEKPREKDDAENDDAIQTKAGVVCEVGLDQESCKLHEECVALQDKSRNGVCKCVSGFSVSSTSGLCEATAPTPPIIKKPKKVTVQAVPKVIELPTNNAMLTAFAIPEDDDYKYAWELVDDGESKKRSGSMANPNDAQLTLTDLEEGVYTFKVTVSAGEETNGGVPDRLGVAFTNVTVLPAPHPNTPPNAVLVPATQNILLPTTRAILDASQSTDDETPKDQLGFKWELAASPLGYQQKLVDGSTLTLDNLIAGNYIVKVTVTDSESESDVATAKITVIPEKDYPPVANAGEDQIVYIPQRTVVLNGNQSTDDHGIVSWEWTRKFNARESNSKELASGGGDGEPEGMKEPAVDTANMRTPNPTLSKLEEGTYTFILKVTDAKGQDGTDEVNVYVKPPTNLPPTADAGKDQEISLPRNWVILDGSKSKDDINVTSYLWSQVSGPNTAHFEDATEVRTNTSGLTKGSYVFNVEVSDDLGNKDSAQTKVEVKQDSNAAPVARAGTDFEVTLPVSVIVINGSSSSDDLGIARWKWSRESSSLAAGNVVGDSDREPVLQLVAMVPGQYTFQLEVWDDQGKTSVDSMTLVVRPNPEAMNVIQAVFNEEMTELTKTRLDGIIQAIGLLLHNSGKYQVKVLKLFPEPDSNNAVIHFIVVQQPSEESAVSISLSSPEAAQVAANGGSPASSQTSEPIGDSGFSNRPALFPTGSVASGKKVVKELQTKLATDASLLGLKILSLDTLICQNECSGHGSCHQATRKCLCEPFWVENFVRRQLMDGKSNCEWSIIYVGIFIAVLGGIVLISVCYLSCAGSIASRTKQLRRRGASGTSTGSGNGQASNGRRRGANGTRYSRLQTEDMDGEPGMEMRNAHTSSLMISETDSDDEELLNFDGSSPLAHSGVSVTSAAITPDPRVVSGGNVAKRNGGSALRRSQQATGLEGTTPSAHA